MWDRPRDFTHERAVLRLTAPSAPLPDFSGFHPAFADDDQSTPEGDVRRAVTGSTPARRWKSPPRPAARGRRQWLENSDLIQSKAAC